MFGGVEPAPQADMPTYENEKHMGRLRKYEEVGIYGDLPVRDVVRFRFVNGRHIEGMSQDMMDEFDHWYFTRPNRKKDGADYAKHLRAWERRERWIADIQTIGSAHPAPVTDLLAERKRRRR